MKVFVVDLGSQWGHLIYRRLRDFDVETKMIPVDSTIESISEVDGLVFSGGALNVGRGDAPLAGNAGHFLDFLVEKNIPVMGVCAGMQFIALRMGGEVKPGVIPEYGNVELTVTNHDDLFEGIPDKFTVFASHQDYVASAPGFKTLAHSKDVPIHAFKHDKKAIYGTLFHPEVAHTQYGNEIYQNFLRICRR